MDDALTDAQLEAAAREFCRLIGVDPDGLQGHGAAPDANGIVPAVWYQSPAWRLAVPVVRRHAALTRAIESVTPR